MHWHNCVLPLTRDAYRSFALMRRRVQFTLWFKHGAGNVSHLVNTGVLLNNVLLRNIMNLPWNANERTWLKRGPLHFQCEQKADRILPRLWETRSTAGDFCQSQYSCNISSYCLQWNRAIAIKLLQFSISTSVLQARKVFETSPVGSTHAKAAQRLTKVVWLQHRPCLVPSWCGTSRNIWHRWKPCDIEFYLGCWSRNFGSGKRVWKVSQQSSSSYVFPELRRLACGPLLTGVDESWWAKNTHHLFVRKLRTESLKISSVARKKTA